MKLSIISPTFNEAENIPRLVTEISRSMEGLDYELLIVDDNSPDRTWAVAEELSRQNSHVRVLRRMRNSGLGFSVIDGFTAASGEMVACIDADLQHDPSILPEMVEQLSAGVDIVVGSRYVDGGGTGNWNLFRRAESWIATKMANVILGIKLKDPMSGYFVMRRAEFARIHQGLNGNGFKILLEILARLRSESVRELPYTFRRRSAGESKLSSKVVFQYVQQLMRLALQQASPLFRFGLVGSFGVLVNLVLTALLLRFSALQDWRASAIASLLANLNNYVLNNHWTFADRVHRGSVLIRGYSSYLATSLLGLGVTTGVYASLTWALPMIYSFQNSGVYNFLARISCQLIAILFGMFFNYKLSKAVIWPTPVVQKGPQLSPQQEAGTTIRL